MRQRVKQEEKVYLPVRGDVSWAGYLSDLGARPPPWTNGNPERLHGKNSRKLLRFEEISYDWTVQNAVDALLMWTIPLTPNLKDTLDGFM